MKRLEVQLYVYGALVAAGVALGFSWPYVLGLTGTQFALVALYIATEHLKRSTTREEVAAFEARLASTEEKLNSLLTVASVARGAAAMGSKAHTPPKAPSPWPGRHGNIGESPKTE